MDKRFGVPSLLTASLLATALPIAALPVSAYAIEQPLRQLSPSVALAPDSQARTTDQGGGTLPFYIFGDTEFDSNAIDPSAAGVHVNILQSSPQSRVPNAREVTAVANGKGTWTFGSHPSPALRQINFTNKQPNALLLDDQLFNVKNDTIWFSGDGDMDNVILHPELAWKTKTLEDGALSISLRLGDDERTVIVTSGVRVFSYGVPDYVLDSSRVSAAGLRPIPAAAHYFDDVLSEGAADKFRQATEPQRPTFEDAKFTALRGGHIRPTEQAVGRTKGTFHRTEIDLRNGWPNTLVIGAEDAPTLLAILGNAGDDKVVFEKPDQWRMTRTINGWFSHPSFVEYEKVNACSDELPSFLWIEKSLPQPVVGDTAQLETEITHH
jgi:hypothetical protein